MSEAMHKILIVDDSAAVRSAVALMLRGGAFECLEAEDGLAALDMLRLHRIDCVISDLHMPRLNGLDFLKQMRELPAYRFTPVLILTTDRVDENREELRRAGATGVLGKPIQPDELMANVQRAIAANI
jgi:two-component system chemotaxis response regulator CheY